MASEPSAALPIPTDQDGSSSAQALRTRKRNRERARATRACDRCKKYATAQHMTSYPAPKQDHADKRCLTQEEDQMQWHTAL